ncbi:MAG: hypothetical protein R2857_04330 [Vampirovibrionales bacterium]
MQSPSEEDFNELAENVEASILSHLKRMLLASPDLRVVIDPNRDTPWATNLGPNEAFVVSPTDPEFSQIPPPGDRDDPQPSPHYTPAYQRHQASPKPPLQVVVPDSLLVELASEALETILFEDEVNRMFQEKKPPQKIQYEGAMSDHDGTATPIPPDNLLTALGMSDFANRITHIQLVQHLLKLTTTDGNPLFNGTGQLLLDINA